MANTSFAQYGQWDGYPEVQGVRILKFLSTPEQTTALKSNLHLLQVATPNERKAIREECEQADGEDILRMEERALNRRYPCLSRNTSAMILNFIADVKEDKPIFINEVKESLEFAMDSLCEWIYVIDLDANKLKVYGGRFREFDVDAAKSRYMLSVKPGGPTECEMLANAVPQFLVEFDIEKLPGEEEFVRQIEDRSSELDGEEYDDGGEEDSEEDDVNGRQGNDEKDGTNRDGGEAAAADVDGD